MSKIVYTLWSKNVEKAFMSIIDGICLAFIEGNCYNSSNLKRKLDFLILKGLKN